MSAPTSYCIVRTSPRGAPDYEGQLRIGDLTLGTIRAYRAPDTRARTRRAALRYEVSYHQLGTHPVAERGFRSVRMASEWLLERFGFPADLPRLPPGKHRR